MNSVHEPSSRTTSKYFDSGKYRVEQGKKKKNRPSAPSAQPWPAQVPRPRAQRPAPPLPPACACAQLPLARARAPTQRPPAARATLALRAPARSPCAPQHARLRPNALARACCLAQRRVVTQLPVLRHRQPCLLPLFLTIQFLYCDTNSLQPSLLQYKFCNTTPLGCNTIQPL